MIRHGQRTTIAAIVLTAAFLAAGTARAGTLSCSVASSCPDGVVVFRMSDTTDAHGELPSQSNYGQLVCCQNVYGLGNACSGTYATVIKLSDVTNAHAEIGTETNYPDSACLDVPAGGSVTVGYQATDCAGYDTTVASMSTADTNAHLGDAAAYPNKICASATGVNPAPHLDTISPTSAWIGQSVELRLTGENFFSGSEVRIDGGARTAHLDGADLVADASGLAVGDHAVTVFNPTPGGGTSDPLTLTINQAWENVTLTSLPVAPASAHVIARRIYRTAANGSTFTLVGEIRDNATTTYTDSASDGSIGGQPPAPTANTTGLVPRYIAALPLDPGTSLSLTGLPIGGNNTGYYIIRTTAGTVIVGACYGENNQAIRLSR